jgi:polyisoprenoid-binding protein YceI
MRKPSINRLLAAGVTSLLAATAISDTAVAQEIASKDPDAVKAGTYSIEPNHTQVDFSITHFGFSNFHGLFSGASGTLELDPTKIDRTRLEVTVPIDTVLTTSTALNGLLRGEQWFDAPKFPTATFTSTKVTPSAVDAATIAGNLTLHGVTRPVTLEAKLVGSEINPLDKAYTVGFDGIVKIKRSDFGPTSTWRFSAITSISVLPPPSC